MPQMTFDLEDGQEPVSFVLSKSDGDRFIAFMEECNDAVKALPGLREEIEAAEDYGEDRARLLGLVREKLGVPSEPHQSIDERTFEAIDEIAARNAVEWSSIAVLKLLEEIEQQVGAAIPTSILNDALAKVGLRERFGNEAIDRAKEAARSALAEKFASGEEE